MAELPHLHEAAILYQVKERHVLEKPYTRVGEIVVAINPCQWIEGLYSKEEQEKYAKILVWQEGTLHYNIVLRGKTGVAALVTFAINNEILTL
jgi:hypothetical protein